MSYLDPPAGGRCGPEPKVMARMLPDLTTGLYCPGPGSELHMEDKEADSDPAKMLRRYLVPTPTGLCNGHRWRGLSYPALALASPRLTLPPPNEQSGSEGLVDRICGKHGADRKVRFGSARQGLWLGQSRIE